MQPMAFDMRMDMPTLPLPHSLQPSPVSKHRQALLNRGLSMTSTP